MAYTVGSASVEIVPDFRGAQLAITKFFQSQPDQLKVPVRPDMDPQAVQQAEVQARTVGNKLGQALAEGADRGVNRGGALGAISRRIAKLEADIEKSRTASTDATRQLRIAETRLQELRALKLEPTSARMLAGERAVELARQKVIDVDKRAAQSTIDLESARRELEESTRAEVERTAQAQIEAQRKLEEARDRTNQAHYARIQREDAAARARAAAEQQRLEAQLARQQVARDRANEQEVAAEIRTAQRIAAEQERIDRQAEAEAARQRERVLREEQSWAQRQAQAFTRAFNQAVRSAEREKIRIEIDQRRALQDSREVGNIVTRAVQHEIHQNAGLIAAAIGGALLLGGPVALAAATTVFGGIATVAVAQNEQVRRTWVGLWDEIKSGAQSDAAILVPTYQRMAGRIGQAFQDIRPQIRDTYDELGDQLETVTASATQMAENAMPGLTQAIRNGMPVAQGFGQLMEDTGTATSDFFSILGANSDTAGEVFRDLGGTMRQVLPLFGELLSEGMTVATAVLPALNTGLRGVNATLDLVGGALPTVLTGFLAFRAVQGVRNILQNWSVDLGMASLEGGRFADAQRRGASALSRIGRALPVVGTAVGAVAAVMASGEAQMDSWTQALIEGGAAARVAQAEMTDPSAWEEFSFAVSNVFNGDAWANWTDSPAILMTRQAREEAEKYLTALDPLSEAKARLNQATNNLSLAMEDENATGQELADAQAEVAHWSARVTSEQEKLERATTGVTEAMVAQGEAARSLADSQFAYENALNDLEDAQEDYNTALAEGNEEEKSRALLALQESYSEVASAARDVAFDAMPAMLNEQQKSILADKAQLDALNDLHNRYGDLGPILEAQRTRLSNIVSQSDGATLAQAQLAAALGEVGIAVEAIPGQKAVKVEALTDEARTRLEGLGIDVVELPDGSFSISANDEDAIADINKINTALGGLDSTTVEPTVDAETGPFDARDAYIRAKARALGDLKPTPKVDLDPQLLNQKGLMARRNLDDLDGQRPTPVANLNASPFNQSLAATNGGIRTLASQRPTPTADLNSGPFNGIVAGVMSSIRNVAGQRPTPTVAAVDAASGIINSVRNNLGSLRDRTITITTVNRQVNETINRALSAISFGGASGGAIEDLRPVYKFDGGGAVIGRGSAREDLVPALGPDPFARYQIANGEHILDGRDVALMGGQAGVYAFREMLKSGRIGNPASSTGVRGMLTQSVGSTSAPAAPAPQEITIMTYDNAPAITRTLRAEQQQREALASPWP